VNITYQEPTYAVFGDAGGHYFPFVKGLEALGVTVGGAPEDFVIPKNLTVIQAGDLVHKGPHSDALVALADIMMKTNNSDPDKGTWVQLIGNHESMYIPGARVFWEFECNETSALTINRWWKEKQAKLHFVIPQNTGKPFMVTHAGVGSYVYNATQRKRKGIEAFSEHIESLQPGRMMEASFAGAMLYGKVSQHAGLFWAESTREVYATWRDLEAPFHQIHGHCPPYAWPQKKFWSNVHVSFRNEIVLDKIKRHSLWQNNGSSFYCIDPGFGTYADKKAMTPLILTHNGVIA
jgi:hypothetical protein